MWFFRFIHAHVILYFVKTFLPWDCVKQKPVNVSFTGPKRLTDSLLISSLAICQANQFEPISPVNAHSRHFKSQTTSVSIEFYIVHGLPQLSDTGDVYGDRFVPWKRAPARHDTDIIELYDYAIPSRSRPSCYTFFRSFALSSCHCGSEGNQLVASVASKYLSPPLWYYYSCIFSHKRAQVFGAGYSSTVKSKCAPQKNIGFIVCK